MKPGCPWLTEREVAAAFNILNTEHQPLFVMVVPPKRHAAPLRRNMFCLYVFFLFDHGTSYITFNRNTEKKGEKVAGKSDARFRLS